MWPSATAIALVSALVGYAARGVGEAEAVKTMYDHMTAPVIEAVKKVQTAEDSVAKTEEEMAKSAKIVADLQGEANKSQQTVSDLLIKVQAYSDEIARARDVSVKIASDAQNLKSLDYQKMVEVLRNDPKFAGTLASLTDEKYTALVREINQLKISLLAAGSDVKTVPGRIMKCPDGYYVIGWAFQDQPGLDHGALWGPTAYCARVNVGTTP